MTHEQAVLYNYLLRMSLIGVIVAIVVNVLQISFFGWIWMAIASYMITEYRYGLTVRACINRVIAAICGTCIGMFLSGIFNLANFSSIAVCLFISAFISGFIIYRNKAFQLMTMNAAVVITMSKISSIGLPAWKIAFERSFETILAAAIVLMVSALIFVGYSFQDRLQKIAKINLFIQDWIGKLIAKLIGNENTQLSIEGLLSEYHQQMTQINAISIEVNYEKQNIPRSQLDHASNVIEIQTRIVALLYILLRNIDFSQNMKVIELFKESFITLLKQIEDVVRALKENTDNSQKILSGTLAKLDENLKVLTSTVNTARKQKLFAESETNSIMQFYILYTNIEMIVEACHHFHTKPLALKI